MKVLVVEDDAEVLEAIVHALHEAGYDVATASSGDDGLWLATEHSYDVILLDIMLPGADGLAITQELRNQDNRTPVILVTARDAVQDRVRGLDAGADDYLIKPFAVTELLARIRAVLRRHGVVEDTQLLTFRELSLHRTSHTAARFEQTVLLSATEYALLEFMLLNKERILTREQLFERVWGFDSDAGERVVDVYIYYLRKKLAAIGCQDYIMTQRGIGFCLQKEAW